MTTNSDPRDRRFLGKPAWIIAAVLVGFALSTLVASIGAQQSTDAWAAGLKNLTPEQGLTLLKLTRDWFQDDELADSSYTVCIDPYDAAAGDAQTKGALEDALKLVQGASRRMGYTDYTDISDDYERIRMSKMLAEGGWMRQFKKSVEACLYAQPGVKAKLERN